MISNNSSASTNSEHFFVLDNIDYKRELKNKIHNSTICYGDLVSSDIALRHNIANVPNEEQWQNLELLCEKILNPLIDNGLEIKIISAFRTPILSAIQGSSTSSNHCKGIAVDFTIKNKPLQEIFEYINKNLIFHEMIAEYFPNGWIHISYKEGSRAKTLKVHNAVNKNQRITINDLVY